MVRAHMGKDQEPAGAWDVVEVEAEWEETDRVQAPREIACVLAVEQRFRIRQGLPAMI
jgi:hypothetical protein